MKALFCTDGSDISFNALKNFSAFATDVETDILCVIDWNFYPMYMSEPEQNFINTYDNLANELLEYSSLLCKKYGQKPTNLKKIWGKTSEEIIHLIKTNYYDVVILGSNGKKGIKNVLGSVSRQVVNHSHIPVFISKQEDNNKKILFTLDGSAGSRYAIKQALNMLNFTDKELYLITVMEDLSNLPLEITSNKEWYNSYLKQRNCFSQNILKDAKSILKQYNLNAKEALALIGSPDTIITNTINTLKIDLVISGSHSKDNFSEFLLGSTSKRVLEKATCSSLIISAKNFKPQ